MSTDISSSSEPQQLKFIVLGQISVGKSSILKRYVSNQAPINPQTTIAIDCLFKNQKVNEKSYKIQLWDSAGHQRYRTVVYSYYHQVSGVVVVFDINSQQTLTEAGQWLQQTRAHCGDDVPIILLANKCDQMRQYELNNKLKQIEPLLESFKQDYGCQFYAVSALNGTNINKSFKELIVRASKIAFKTQLKKTIKLKSQIVSNCVSVKRKKTCC